jgi:hypothetical protein
MAQHILPEHLAREVDDLARQENRAWEEIVEELVKERAAKLAEQEEIRLRIARKLYPMAREYWQEAGDETRLALTDEQLDEQFWLIDQDGIPRLKEDEGKVYIAPSPLEAMAGIFDEGPEDLSTSVKETMRAIFQRKANGG